MCINSYVINHLTVILTFILDIPFYCLCPHSRDRKSYGSFSHLGNVKIVMLSLVEIFITPWNHLWNVSVYMNRFFRFYSLSWCRNRYRKTYIKNTWLQRIEKYVRNNLLFSIALKLYLLFYSTDRSSKVHEVPTKSNRCSLHTSMW